MLALSTSVACQPKSWSEGGPLQPAQGLWKTAQHRYTVERYGSVTVDGALASRIGFDGRAALPGQESPWFWIDWDGSVWLYAAERRNPELTR